MRDKDVQRQDKKGKRSRYNEAYQLIMTEDWPWYLGRENRKEKMMIERFRCGYEERENR